MLGGGKFNFYIICHHFGPPSICVSVLCGVLSVQNLWPFFNCVRSVCLFFLLLRIHIYVYICIYIYIHTHTHIEIYIWYQFFFLDLCFKNTFSESVAYLTISEKTYFHTNLLSLLFCSPYLSLGASLSSSWESLVSPHLEVLCSLLRGVPFLGRQETHC